MRRLLTAAVAGAALFSMTACADDDSDTDTDAAASPSAMATSAAPTGDNTEACAELDGAAQEFQAAAAPIVTELGTAVTNNDEEAVGQHISELSTVLGSFKDEYNTVMMEVDDPELKAAIEQDLQAIDDATGALVASGGDPEKIQEIVSDPEFTATGQEVSEVCSQ